MSAATITKPAAKPVRSQSAAEQIERIVSTATPPISPASACIVEQIGRLSKQASEAYQAADVWATSQGDTVDASNARQVQRVFYERGEILRDLASHDCAKSCAGAMFQVAAVHYWIGHIVELAGAENERHIEKLEQQASAALYSVLRLLEVLAGHDRSVVGADVGMPDFLDPHTIMSRALKGHHGLDPARFVKQPRPATKASLFLRALDHGVTDHREAGRDR